MSGQSLEEVSRERCRIATRIHDEVLPHLAAAAIQADNVRAALRDHDSPRGDELAGRTQQAVHDGIARLREVLDDLQRQVVVPGRLRETLEDSLRELRETEHLEARLEAAAVLPSVPFSVELLVVETVHGCLANVVRHAGASSVTVSLSVYDCHVAVRVRDDGCGFDPERTPRGQGLSLMEKRVRTAGGRVELDSAPGRGTCVTIEVPR